MPHFSFLLLLGVVVQRGCSTVQCAPNFVCVTRNTPPVGELPFCVPGNSADCTQLRCPTGQTCTFREVTNCGSPTCLAVAQCTPIGGGTTTTTTATTTTTTRSTTTTTRPTTTTTPRTTTTTTTRRTTTTTPRTTTTTTRRFTTRPTTTTRRTTLTVTRPTTTTTTRRFTTSTTTRRPTTKPSYIIYPNIPGIRYCVADAYPEPSMYPVPPSYAPAPRSTRPAAPISIPSSIPNPGPSPNFPIPPPGTPATRTQVSLSAPPLPAPLPAGVRPPSAPRAIGTATGIRSSPTSSSSLPSYSSPSFSPSSLTVSAPGSSTNTRVQTPSSPSNSGADAYATFSNQQNRISAANVRTSISNRRSRTFSRVPKWDSKRSKVAPWNANSWRQEISEF
ncbi:hypothetical protein V3C99_015510 [Haemonchus contortus]